MLAPARWQISRMVASRNPRSANTDVAADRSIWRVSNDGLASVEGGVTVLTPDKLSFELLDVKQQFETAVFVYTFPIYRAFTRSLLNAEAT